MASGDEKKGSRNNIFTKKSSQGQFSPEEYEIADRVLLTTAKQNWIPGEIETVFNLYKGATYLMTDFLSLHPAAATAYQLRNLKTRRILHGFFYGRELRRLGFGSDEDEESDPLAASSSSSQSESSGESEAEESAPVATRTRRRKVQEKSGDAPVASRTRSKKSEPAI